MTGERVPKKMRAIYNQIVAQKAEVCQTYLNDEYARLSQIMAATLARKRPSPLEQGRASSWACGIVYALGQANFLFDKSQTPHLSAHELVDLFRVS